MREQLWRVNARDGTSSGGTADQSEPSETAGLRLPRSNKPTPVFAPGRAGGDKPSRNEGLELTGPQSRLVQAVGRGLLSDGAKSFTFNDNYDPRIKEPWQHIRFIDLSNPEGSKHHALTAHTGGNDHHIVYSVYSIDEVTRTTVSTIWNPRFDPEGLEASFSSYIGEITDPKIFRKEIEIWKMYGGLDQPGAAVGLRQTSADELNRLAEDIEHGEPNHELTAAAIKYLQDLHGNETKMNQAISSTLPNATESEGLPRTRRREIPPPKI